MKRKPIKDLTYCDDDFMRVALNNNVDAVQTIIDVLLDDTDLDIISTTTQKHIPSFKKGIYLDIYAEGKDGTIYDIEIQNRFPNDTKLLYKRIRYYQSSMDSELIEKGQEYEALKQTYIIFLLQRDSLSQGEPLYDILAIDRNTGICIDTEAHWLLGNLKHQFKDINSELSKLFHDLNCKDPDQIYFKSLRETMKYYKKTERGMKMIDEYVGSSFEVGWHEGSENEKKKYIRRMLEKQFSLEDIAELTDMDINELKRFIKKYNLH